MEYQDLPAEIDNDGVSKQMIEERCPAGSLQDKTAKKAIYWIREPKDRVSVERVNLGKAADGGAQWSRETRGKAEPGKMHPLQARWVLKDCGTSKWRSLSVIYG